MRKRNVHTFLEENINNLVVSDKPNYLRLQYKTVLRQDVEDHDKDHSKRIITKSESLLNDEYRLLSCLPISC